MQPYLGAGPIKAIGLTSEQTFAELHSKYLCNNSQHFSCGVCVCECVCEWNLGDMIRGLFLSWLNISTVKETTPLLNCYIRENISYPQPPTSRSLPTVSAWEALRSTYFTKRGYKASIPFRMRPHKSGY